VTLDLTRQRLLSPDDAARVHALALRILDEIGVDVPDSGVRRSLQGHGFSTVGTRTLITPSVADAYADEMRAGLEPGRSPDDTEEAPGPIMLTVSSYALQLHDLESDSVVPMTAPRLIEMCKLVDNLAEEGVVNAPPGIPTEIHPDLQPLAQYRIAATTARQGASPVDPTSAVTVNYLLDMAEVMAQPITSLPIYIPTPLRFGGDSLDVVLACLDRLDEIRVSSMPSTGASAPMQPFGALALSVAEVLGGAVLAHALTGKRATFGIGLFPFDLRAGAMVFGAPESMLFQLLCQDLNTFYGWGWHSAPNNIHVMAKRPDAQAAAEKAAIMALGAGLGARRFDCAGALSLDEIFSPEQLVLDCEIRNWTARALQGITLGAGDVDDWLGEIRAGIQHGFMALDSTLDHYKEQMWYPKRFERRASGPWLSEGQPHLSTRLHDEVRRRIAAHDFELDSGRCRDLDRIYHAAESAIKSRITHAGSHVSAP
jgi:trimethylamine---corrinoid protein Co-methyltransferase